ncbi:MAG: tetratricopeptide repeat protein, partial [Candidatus Hodarchaeota archaeon]
MSDPSTITEIKTKKTDEVLDDLFSIQESHLKKAAKYFEEAAELAREITDKPTEARLLGKLGEVYGKLDNSTDAIKNYQNSRKIYNSIGDKKNELKILMSLGEVQKVSNRLKNSRESYQQAADLAKNSGELTAEETC